MKTEGVTVVEYKGEDVRETRSYASEESPKKEEKSQPLTLEQQMREKALASMRERMKAKLEKDQKKS